MALGGVVPSFAGDGWGFLQDFLHALEQAGRLGGWNDSQLMGIALCKMVGAAYDFALPDKAVAAATKLSDFKALATKRVDTEL
ncbi:hypothetical protein HPB48_003490 [Haemaphysalis longicornis]|uniref:Uncharacterized protein n=1 Tax=Haemaphysalis longicornis TaxID=44386 RepID=A0A9J6FU11_HAELO|nr:hypothetical protein HPB48_003490 [Haemaphysalis longicornis]